MIKKEHHTHDDDGNVIRLKYIQIIQSRVASLNNMEKWNFKLLSSAF
jgi:hypothetical protein